MQKPTVVLGLINPKTPANVGAVLRAAGCFRADAVFYTGVRYPRAARFHTDTKDAGRSIPLHGVESLLDVVAAGMRVVCVELVEGAQALPDFEHPEQAMYVFGPEDGTLSQELIDRADAVVYVPSIGSLNLAATVNVVLYDRLAKAQQQAQGALAGNELIRRSRDRNNNLKLKGGG